MKGSIFLSFTQLPDYSAKEEYIPAAAQLETSTASCKKESSKDNEVYSILTFISLPSCLLA